MADELKPVLRGERELLRARTSPSGYGGPAPSYTLILRLDDARGFYVETIAESEDDTRRWRVPVDLREAQDSLSRLAQARVPVFLESPASVDGQYVEVTVPGIGADLTIGWWNIPPAGAEVFAELVEWLFANSPLANLEHDDVDVLYDRLVSLARSFRSTLLHNDRKAVLKKVLNRTIAHLKKLPSPAPMNDNDSLCDFIGQMKAGQADTYLYELAVGEARDQLESQVSKLDDPDTLALLLPMVDDDVEDLARDRDIDQWPESLRGESSLWLNTLVDELMRQIPERQAE
jgi:hypothetical protein